MAIIKEAREVASRLQQTRVEAPQELQPEESLSRDDVLLAVRKMRCFVEEKIAQAEVVRQRQLSQIEELLNRMIQEVALLREEVKQKDSKTEEISINMTKLAGEQKSLRDYWDAQGTLLHKELFEAISNQAASQDQWLSKRLDNISKEHGSDIDSMNKAFNFGVESAMQKMLTIMKNMPTPQVNMTNVIPESAIKVLQEPSQVHVNVPQQLPPAVNLKDIKLVMDEKSFNVMIDQPAPHVHLPEGAIQIKTLPSIVNLPEGAIKILQEPSNVHVNVPQQLPPDVHVNMPRRKVKKLIKYDEQSRPCSIVEEEVYEKD